MAQDIRLGNKTLEFDLGELAIPVHIWQGSADTLVPRNYSERLVEMISGAKLHRVAHRGHFFIMQFMDEVFSSLSAPRRIRNSVSSLISRDSLVLRKSA